MNFKVILGDTEKTHLIVQRNWITGSLFYLENGDMKSLKSTVNASASLTMTLKKTFEFVVGTNEKHKIRLERTRPLIFGGIRPHSYELFVNDELIQSYKGF